MRFGRLAKLRDRVNYSKSCLWQGMQDWERKEMLPGIQRGSERARELGPRRPCEWNWSDNYDYGGAEGHD